MDHPADQRQQPKTDAQPARPRRCRPVQFVHQLGHLQECHRDRRVAHQPACNEGQADRSWPLAVDDQSNGRKNGEG
jgi:hypothetical protein